MMSSVFSACFAETVYDVEGLAPCCLHAAIQLISLYLLSSNLLLCTFVLLYLSSFSHPKEYRSDSQADGGAPAPGGHE